ncbi:MAG: hypothetical protein R3362_12435 [Rhodothermales bacterium]|nr:hypothetical protein [Rhodothermales bacterium]
MSTPDLRPLKLLRIAAVVVVVAALGFSVWLIDTAGLNPDVHAKQPGWFDGAITIPYWLPLILTVAVGAAAVVYVYVKAAKRLRAGEDLYGNSYRERARQGLGGARYRDETAK